MAQYFPAFLLLFVFFYEIMNVCGSFICTKRKSPASASVSATAGDLSSMK